LNDAVAFINKLGKEVVKRNVVRNHESVDQKVSTPSNHQCSHRERQICAHQQPVQAPSCALSLLMS